MKQRPVIYTDDDEERPLPFNWAICGGCSGHGKSSAYLGAYTCEEMREAGPEFHDDYMAGRYDKTCDRCDGSGKVPVLDRSKCKPADLKEYDEQMKAERECRAIERAERRMGA